MCKLFGISDFSGTKRDLLEATLLAAKAQFSGEKDGFGWAVRTTDGIYAERYCNPRDFTGVRSGSVLASRLKPIRDGLDFEYESVRRLRRITGGLIVHGRTSTNSPGVENTHPFTKKGWAMAHNGIVTYNGPERHRRGDCDSEDILNSFVYGDGLEELSEHYTGYAAVLALPRKRGFIAYRDQKANLHVSRLEDCNGAYAFSTTAAHLAAILKKAGLTGTTPVPLRHEHAITFDGVGEPSVEHHESPGYRYTTPAESRATGYHNSGFFGGAARRKNGAVGTQRTAPASTAPKRSVATQTTFPDYDPDMTTVDGDTGAPLVGYDWDGTDD